jgi:PLP dependent protein
MRDSGVPFRGDVQSTCMPEQRSIAENIRRVEEKLLAACRRAGRSEGEVTLMAVSKTHPAQAIADAFAAGIRLFGENRVQEFQQKSLALRELGTGVSLDSGDGITAQIQAQVHLIGHLQSNKVARAVEIFTAVDTVDSLKLALRLDEAAGKLGRRLSVLLEIKISEEPAKTGFEPQSPELAALLERLPDLRHLQMRGMMTVAPLDEKPDAARDCFRQLRRRQEQFIARYPGLDFSELSMGMSGDFEIAIEEGSTLVRIGTAIFGSRPRPA